MRKGDRIRMTHVAILRRLDGPKSKRCGVMVGESRDGKMIYVRRDGELSRMRFAREFWETDVSYPKPDTEKG